MIYDSKKPIVLIDSTNLGVTYDAHNTYHETQLDFFTQIASGNPMSESDADEMILANQEAMEIFRQTQRERERDIQVNLFNLVTLASKIATPQNGSEIQLLVTIGKTHSGFYNDIVDNPALGAGNSAELVFETNSPFTVREELLLTDTPFTKEFSAQVLLFGYLYNVNLLPFNREHMRNDAEYYRTVSSYIDAICRQLNYADIVNLLTGTKQERKSKLMNTINTLLDNEQIPPLENIAI